MTVPKVKSRPQLRSQAKQRRTSKKHHVDKPKAKQTNNDAQSPTKAPKVYMSSAESNDPIHDDNSNSVDDNGSSFARRHVLTTNDQESAGAFKSGLRTVLIRDRAPVTTDSSEATDGAADEHDHETSGTCESEYRNESEDDGASAVPCGSGAPGDFTDEDDDPPASLLNLAPLWYPQSDWSWPDTLPAATETTLDDSPVAEHATADPSQVSEETTADGLSGVAVAAPNSPSTRPDTTVAVASASTVVTAHPASAAATTTADPSSVSTVAPAILTPVVAVTATDCTPAVAITAATLAQVSTGSSRKPSLGTWHNWVVELFAGRKSVSPKNDDVSNTPPPVSIISWTREDRDSDTALPLPSQPHLELSYLIPATFDKRMRLNYHSNIHPAPQHDSVGKVAAHEDASPTNNVQRGFVVANRPASAPSPPRRDVDHYSSLLARDDTNWAEWNKLNITADTMPFTRSQSDTQLLHPQTGMKMARANGHLTKSQTGHAFLEDAGHRYPFGQGPGW